MGSAQDRLSKLERAAATQSDRPTKARLVAECEAFVARIIATISPADIEIDEARAALIMAGWRKDWTTA